MHTARLAILVVVVCLPAVATGQPASAGPEVALAPSSASSALLGDVTTDPTGGYVVAWEWFGGGLDAAVARRVDDTGTPAPGTIPIDHDVEGRPTVAASPDGRVVAAWSKRRFTDREVLARAIDPLRPGDSASGHVLPPSAEPQLAAGADRFLLVWSTGDSNFLQARARWLDLDAKPLGEVLRLDTSAGSAASVADGPGGHVIATWREDDSTWAVVYGPDGAVVTPPFVVRTHSYLALLNQTVAIAGTADGFVALFAQQERDGGFITDVAMALQHFTLDGIPGPVVRVGAIDTWATSFDVAVNHAGIALVVWTDSIHQSARGNLHAAFVARGVAGATVELNTPDVDADVVRAAAGADGRFFVTWNARGIRGRLVGACGNGVLDPGETCDDGNVRAGDCCSPLCRAEPVAGTCWRFASTTLLRFGASPTIRGIPATCSARCRTTSSVTVVLLDDGTYRVPQGTTSCTDGGAIDLPDEVGRWSAKADTIKLRPSNDDEVRSVLEGCTGTRLGPTRTTLRRQGSAALRGTQTVQFRRAGRPRVTVRAESRLAGVRLDAGALPVAPVFASKTDVCEASVRLRCRAR